MVSPEGSASSPWFTGLKAALQRAVPSLPSPPACNPAGPGAAATGHQPRTERSPPACSFSIQGATPTLIPEGRVSITHWATYVGGVVDAGRPLVSAVAVCGDEPVLLGVSGAAVDLVLPAGLGRTFHPRAAGKREVTFEGKNASCRWLRNSTLSSS